MSKLITDESVADAAEELSAAGSNPTVRAIREKLGGGSNSSILTALNAWKKEKKDRVALEDIEVPETIIEHADVLIARIWRAAMEEAGAGHNAMRQEVIAAEGEIKRIQDEFADLIREGEVALESAQTEADELRAERGKLIDEVAESKVELARLDERAKAAAKSAEVAEQRAARAEERADRADERIEALIKKQEADTKA